MSALAFDLLAAPPEVGRVLAAVPLVMAALYLPSLWASVARTGSRQSVLRASVGASLAMAFTGSFVFGFFILIVLLPATALLWLASGGPRPKR